MDVQTGEEREQALCVDECHPLDLSTDELWQLQEQHSTLQAVREAAQGTGSTVGRGFFVRDGLIYQRYVPPDGDIKEAVDQLVLPTQCRETVLEVARSISLAGHLGKAVVTQCCETVLEVAHSISLAGEFIEKILL